MIVDRIEFAVSDPAYPQFIAVLENVYVSRRGLIFDRNFELLPEVNFNAGFWPAYTPANGVRDIDAIARDELTAREIIELAADAPYVYAVHYFGRYVFGHLWDTLQPLMKIEHRGPDERRLLVNRLSDDVNDLSCHFDLFGYDESMRTDVKALTHVPELWYPSVVCYPGRVTHEGRDWMRHKYINNNPASSDEPQAEPVDLYLSRNDRRGNVKRRVTNNGQVESLLTEHGFRVLDGSEPLNEHIGLFRRARRIVGPHGSMFRNVLFSDPGCEVLEFCSDRRLDMSLLEVGRNCGMHYQLLEVQGDEDNNITVHLDVLRRWLSSLPVEGARS